MAILFQCKCGKPLRANPEAAGKKTKCPHCQALISIPGGGPKPELVVFGVTAAAAAAGVAAVVPAPAEEDPLAPRLDWASIEAAPARPGSSAEAPKVANPMIQIDAGVAGSLVVDVPRTMDGSRQYRVLGQKDQGFSGKFNPGKLEEVLNAYAQRGWDLKAAVPVNIPGHGGMPGHEELVVILER